MAQAFGVPLSQCTDDRHVRQLLVPSPQEPWVPSIRDAKAAAYILCYLLIGAGYLRT